MDMMFNTEIIVKDMKGGKEDMTEKRYYCRDYEELYYIFDSNTISEKEFDEKEEYEGYTAFEDSLTSEEIIKLLNENEQLKKELKRCRDWLNSDKNDYQLTLAFIKSKGYSLKDVLEYEKELGE